MTGSVDRRVSVVIPCHSEARWPHLVRAVASVQEQRPAPVRVVVAVDNNPNLLARARQELTGITVVPNRFAAGAAGNRNSGIFATDTTFVALLDDDARARPRWLSRMLEPFADPTVVGTGGAAVPDWQSRRPRWFPDEFLWAVGASLADLPDGPERTRNVWSLAMAVRRTEFEAVGGFRVGFTKVGTRSRPEDTDLCLRMGRDGGQWVFVPDAVVDHMVPLDRARLRYVLTRCYNEGRGKISIARRHRGRRDLDLELRYLGRTLPRAMARELAGAVRRFEAAGLARAGVVVAAVAAAAFGGAIEIVNPGRDSDAPATEIRTADAVPEAAIPPQVVRAVLAPSGAEVKSGGHR
jgi:glucosyl-dolichyl phosphate glucuronosyltransferase